MYTGPALPTSNSAAPRTHAPSRYNRAMAGGRKSPALFELLGNSKGVAPPLPPRPVSVPVPPDARASAAHPSSLTPPPPNDPAPLESASDTLPATNTLDRHLRVPMSAIYLSIAGLLLIVLLVWGLAYRIGRSEEKVKTDKLLGAAAGQQVTDPLKSSSQPEQTQINPNLVSPRTPVSIDQSARKPATPTLPERSAAKPSSLPQNAPQAAVPASIPGQPAFGTDPRQSGLNYLIVEGRLDRDSAERIQEFLGENGIPAFAVVDDRNGATNNPALYLVGIAQGFAKGEYKSQAGTDLAERVRRLGQQWQSQRRGTTSFAQTYWALKK